MIWMEAAYCFGGAMLMLMLIGLVLSAVLPVLSRWSRRYFIIIFSILTLTIVAYLIDIITLGKPDMADVERIVIFFEGFLHPIMVTAPTLYLLHHCKEDIKKSWLFRIVATLCVVDFVLVFIGHFTNLFYHITQENHFVRGPWFPLLIIPMIIILALNLAAVIRRRNELSRRMVIAFLVYMIPLIAGLIVHIFISVYLILDFGIALFALAMFCIILSEEHEQYRKQQKEIARQRANIMMLQMRPHFIYNSLTSIYYLCEQDPEKAQQVIMDFTSYLRKIFNAISSDYTIPFLEELEHTRAYLAVEKALHDDLLFVSYDTPHTRFRMPPLTLQPIVENAIKHGLDPDAEPLHISIRTCKTDSGTRITVEDNGLGFNQTDNNKIQPALSNIEQRLEMMCNGTITVAQREEGGTIVTVIIPQTFN